MTAKKKTAKVKTAKVKTAKIELSHGQHKTLWLLATGQPLPPYNSFFERADELVALNLLRKNSDGRYAVTTLGYIEYALLGPVQPAA